MRSKFYGIKFPIFTTKRIPDNEYFKQGMLFILPQKGNIDKLLLVDDSSLEYIYPKRLELLRTTSYDVIQYDYTCTSLSALLLSKSKWGYDSTGRTHYFDKNIREYKLSYRKINKVRKNSFWTDAISHPFDLPDFLIDITDLKNLWVGLVYVDFCWHIYEFSPFYKNKDRIRL